MNSQESTASSVQKRARGTHKKVPVDHVVSMSMETDPTAVDGIIYSKTVFHPLFNRWIVAMCGNIHRIINIHVCWDF